MSVPSSTYRLQLRPEFGFDAVAAVAPYLAQLGISHVYLSPHFQAVAGSTHGYDVVDHSRVNDELGGAEAHERMCSALKAVGLGLIIDVVPNHMAIPGRANAWWWDVLKHGERSTYADYFDVDWKAIFNEGTGKVLLPVLGDRYGAVLERGELQVVLGPDGPAFRYFDDEFPIEELTATEVEDIEGLNADSERLHVLLESQHYRLAYWRLAEEQLEYRRFFDINNLMALRAERPEVFDDTHRLIAQWAQAGVIDGLRIDHVDGLADPAEYLGRVRQLLGDDGYLVVEKILEPGEVLRPSWPVAGTTGYEALRLVDGLFVDPESETNLTSTFSAFTGFDQTWRDTVDSCKALVVEELFGSDVGRLAEQLRMICESRIRTRDFSRLQIRSALSALVAAFGVYRTYVAPQSSYIADADETEIVRATEMARLSIEADAGPVVDFVIEMLTLKTVGEDEAAFVARFQQLTGPVMAKGMEDTASYRYNRLSMLNEVGGDPGRMGVRPEQFHEAASATQKMWPFTMTTATTHDTKRSEDTRYRLALLSERAGQWHEAVSGWAAINEKHRRATDASAATLDLWPDRNTEYVIYQTIVGAYPIEEDRLVEYALKAVREARIFTTWQTNNEPYEQAVSAFVRAICSDADFQATLADFVTPLVRLGYLNSLAATTLHLTMPGVPDTFQGSELWNLSLVDPDNRRAVDFETRSALLNSFDDNAQPPDIDDSGQAKLWLMHKLLQLRRRRSTSFDDQSEYRPLNASGERAGHLVAFRRHEVVVAVSRLIAGLDNEWEDTVITLPEGTWQDVFTGARHRGQVPAKVLLEAWPVAVLELQDA